MYLKKKIIKLFFNGKDDFDFDGKYNVGLAENSSTKLVRYEDIKLLFSTYSYF